MGRDVGMNIKKRRKEMRLSQARLSPLSGISQSAISDIENPDVTKRPNTDTIQKIAAALQCTVSELMGEKADGQEKPADLGGLDEQLVEMLVNLPEQDVQRVKDFVAGLKAAQKG